MACFILVALAASAIDIVASWTLKHADLGPARRVAVALLPFPGNLALIALVLRGIRQLDEFQRRVHFEAVTIGFLATGVVVFVYGYLQKAQAVGPLNLAFIWVFMSFSYAIGYLIAARHYR
ncbi:MAG: hypothetical protein ABSH32_26390 [Bryobacteraceae bacterium]